MTYFSSLYSILLSICMDKNHLTITYSIVLSFLSPSRLCRQMNIAAAPRMAAAAENRLIRRRTFTAARLLTSSAISLLLRMTHPLSLRNKIVHKFPFTY